MFRFNTKNLNFKNILIYLTLIFPVIYIFGSFIINLMIFLMIIIYIALNLKNHAFLQEFLKYPNYLLILFLIFLSISNFINQVDQINLLKSLLYVRFFILFFIIKYVLMVANSSQHILFSKIYFFYLIFFCSDILFQYTFGFDIFGFKPGMCDDNGENCQRFSGILNQELIAGGYLSTFGILILLHLKNFFFKKELFFNIFTFFIFFSIIVTGERSALIITIIFFIVYYFFTTSIKKYLIILLFLITTILIFSLTSPSFKERYYGYFKSEISKEVQGYNYNLNKYEKFKTLPWILHYSASIEMIKKNLLFGNGFKSFRVKCHEYSEINLRKSNQYQVCSTHPHNFHLELFVDMGVFGLIFFLFWYLNLKNIVNQDKNMISKKNYLFCLIYLIIFIFLFRPTGSIFNSNFASIFWFITSYFFHTINFFDKKKYGF